MIGCDLTASDSRGLTIPTYLPTELSGILLGCPLTLVRQPDAFLRALREDRPGGGCQGRHIRGG